MGEIKLKLNLDDSMRVLNNPDAGPDARVISACSVAFFEARNALGEVEGATKVIAQKLLRMTASALDEAVDE